MTADGADEPRLPSKPSSLFPDREELLRRVKRWMPTDGQKIGGATVSAALELRRHRRGGVYFVAVRDIKAGMYESCSATVTWAATMV